VKWGFFGTVLGIFGVAFVRALKRLLIVINFNPSRSLFY